MDSKKAFTLIELLAVIVILAIVLSIAAVAISGTIENSRNESFKASLSAAARKISYEVSQGGPATGTLENLNLQGDKLSGFYVYDYIKGQVIFGKNTRNDTIGTCINTTNYLNGIQNSNIVKCSTLSKGLVAHWKFDGNTNDETIFNNNGTNYGAILTTDRNGKSNSAYSFNGGSSYIEVLHNDILNPTDMTISFWMYSNAWSSPTATSILSKRSTISNGWAILLIGTPTGIINLDFNSGGQDRWATGYSPSTGQWINLVFTKSSTSRNLYVNGILNNSQPGSGGTDLTPVSLYFGKNRVASDQFFNGKIDDVKIYNRALSNTEVLELYNIYE